MNWVLAPHWSTRTIAAIAVGLVVIALIRLVREKRGRLPLVLRLAVLVLLAVVLLNPQQLLPRDRETRPKLVVLVDTSSSMATPDADGRARLEVAATALREGWPALSSKFDLQLKRFDRSSAAAEVEALLDSRQGADATDLRSALMTAVSEVGSAPGSGGVVLISDGRATTDASLEAAQLALARSVPIWTATLGGPVPRHDLWIETASSEVLAFSDAEVELTATLHAAGYPNRSFIVELVSGEAIVARRELVPDAAGRARVAMRVKAPEAGEQRYVFRVAHHPEESDVANNERAVFLRSVGARVRVLVVEGQPHWDTKFLVQMLRRHPNVELTTVYRLSATRHVAIVSATGTETRVEEDLFPRSQGAMNAFDIILLGRGADAFFGDETESQLTEFVSRRAGSVVFARGKPYGGRFQPLAKLEPVAWGIGAAPGPRLKPTETGRENPIFDFGSAGTLDELLEKLPALDQASVTLGEKPLAVVLAESHEADGPVLLAYQRYGQGKAVSLNAGGLWRWAFRESEAEESELAYQRFWVSLLQWLLGGGQFLPGADVALASTRRYYTSEQAMQFLISTRNLDRAVYQPRLIISSQDQEIELQPRPRGDSFVAEAGPLPPGTYRVTLRNNVGSPAELMQSVEVLNASVEKRELSADPELMRRLAEVSGGRAIAISEVNQMPAIFERWEISRQLAHRQQPLWDQPWVLATLLGLLGAEWWLRRREGLL